MVQEKQSDRQERLDKFLQAVDSAQKLQHDIMKYGLEAAHFYCDNVDGDWLEIWGKDEDEQQNFVELVTNLLQSDDLLAVTIRTQVKCKSLQEIAIGLEKKLCGAMPMAASYAPHNIKSSRI